MTMTLLKSRLERLERNLRFNEWLSVQRIFDTWTDDELETYASQGCLPANPFNRARPVHGSLDGMDRKALMKLWVESERAFRSQGLNKPLPSS